MRLKEHLTIRIRASGHAIPGSEGSLSAYGVFATPIEAITVTAKAFPIFPPIHIHLTFGLANRIDFRFQREVVQRIVGKREEDANPPGQQLIRVCESDGDFSLGAGRKLGIRDAPMTG